MITLVLLAILFHVGFSGPHSYNVKPFRPSQPLSIADRIQSPVPAKEYGPPEPVYGVPNKPDDSVEPTTPSNNFRNVPFKFHNMNYQTEGRIQNASLNYYRETNLAFPSQQLGAQQFDQWSQQQLPEVNGQFFFRKQKLPIFATSNSFQSQLLPNPIQAYTFNENRPTAQLFQFPPNSQQLPFKNSNVDIQKSQQFQWKETMLTGSSPNNVNFNNQNSINVQTPPLFNINSAPKQNTLRNNSNFQQGTTNPRLLMKKVNNNNSQVELLNGNQFDNYEIVASKRASNSRTSGKTASAPSRQYFSQLPPPSESMTPPTERKRPTTTEASETGNNPVAKGPNVSISNSFVGRLFLLQPDGRLEPVILKRVNANHRNIPDRNEINTAKLF